MGPIALYKFDELEQKKIQNRLKWIDNGNKANNLRTNASEDDLVFKDEPEPIMSHKQAPILKSIIKVKGEELGFNFYKPEDKLGDEGPTEEPDLQAHQTEDMTKTTTIAGVINYDPMVGNKEFGNTMPLPKKNKLLESNRNKEDEDLACKKFLEQIKQGDGINKKL